MMDAGFKSCKALQLLKTSAVLHAEWRRIRFFWKELGLLANVMMSKITMCSDPSHRVR